MNPIDYTSILTEMLNQSKQLNELTPLKVLQSLLPFITALISALFGAYIGYKVSRSHEKRKFKRENHFEIVKALHKYLFKINEIVIAITNINQLYVKAIKVAKPELYFNPDDDFYSVAYNCKHIKTYVESGVGIQRLKDINMGEYKNKIIELVDKITDFDLFINASSELEKYANDYFLFIDKDLRVEYQKLFSSIALATQETMHNFRILHHKDNVTDLTKKLVDRIKKYS